MPFGSFFENFARLASLKNQIDAQQLAERVAQGSLVSNGAQWAANIEAGAPRDQFIRLFSQNTGIDETMLRESVRALPTATEIIRARKTEAGAGAVPDSAVATAELTSQGEAGVATGNVIAQLLKDKTGPGFKAPVGMEQQILAQTLTGMTPGEQNLDTGLQGLTPMQTGRAAEIGKGLALSAPQEAGYNMDATQLQQNEKHFQQRLAQDERFKASDTALAQTGLALEQMKIKAATGQALGIEDRLAVMDMARKITDALQTGGLDDQTASMYAIQLMEARILLGADPSAARKMSGVEALEKRGGVSGWGSGTGDWITRNLTGEKGIPR